MTAYGLKGSTGGGNGQDTESVPTKGVVERAKANWKLTSGVYSPQKEREIEDLAFCMPENQWPVEAQRDRAKWTDGTNTFPARPMPSIDKLAQPLKIVVNQWRAAHLGINITPESENADKETAEVIQDRYRKDEHDTRADLARYWAFDRAIKAGLGFYFLGYDYDDTSENEFDMRVKWERVPYQSSIYFDPSATEMDWSDGDYVFWIQWLSRDKFIRDFGKSELARRLNTGGPDAWRDLVQQEPDWARGKSNDGAKDAVMVAKYWEKQYTEREIALLDDYSVADAGKVPRGRKVVTTRVVRDQTLNYYCLTGLEDKPLHASKWNGKYLPIVPVIGEEVQPYDDQRRWQGMVRPAKDAQRTFNWAFANAIEEESLKSKAPRLVDPRQIAKYRAWWDQANVRPFPFLPYDAQINGQGQILPPPTIDQADMSKMQGTFMVLNAAGEAIQDTTHLFDASLGKRDPRDRSGKAILAQQGQGDEATSGPTQNFVQITLPCEARIYLDYFGTIYERPGRVMELRNAEGKSRKVALNVPYRVVNGMPQQVAPGTQGAKMHDVRGDGVYGVRAEAGRSFTSRLQQLQQMLPEVMHALGPETALILAPQLLRASNLPGTTESAEKLQMLVDQKYPALTEQQGQELSPEQLKSQNVMLKQQMQQLQQVLQQAAMESKTDRAKQEAQITKTQMEGSVTAAKTMSDNETKLEIAKMDNQTKLAIAELQVGYKQLADTVAAKLDLLKQSIDLMQERRLDDQQGAHEFGLEAMRARTAQAQADTAMGHEAGMTAAGMRADSDAAAQERDFAAEQAEADRAMVPQADGSGE